MLRVGIIGCGKIADQHATAIQRIPGCEIVAACDHEELMAKQFSERFSVGHYFTNPRDLLEQTHPDVIHITTPPQSHFSLGQFCLEAGCHIYVEKPFTINTEEAEQLIELAKRRNLRITVGHNHQFTHAAIRMRELIQGGFLGGPPVHMESYYCYSLGDPTYARAVLGDKGHWVRALPGKLLQNIISHGVSKIAEFIKGDNPNVIALGFTSELLKKMGEDIIDELRVIIRGNGGPTAYFTFSSQMKPALHQFRIYGPENGLIMDDAHQTVIRINGRKYKSYLEHFVPPVLLANEYLANLRTNLRKFLRRDFHNDSGMKVLIQMFYNSITDNRPLPISYQEVLTTSSIMDNIFAQIGGSKQRNCSS